MVSLSLGKRKEKGAGEEETIMAGGTEHTALVVSRLLCKEWNVLPVQICEGIAEIHSWRGENVCQSVCVSEQRGLRNTKNACV